MARTDEAEWWFNAVYSAVQEIPYGKVTSYGHIARLLGQPQRPRQVGICLKHLPLPRNHTTTAAAATASSNGQEQEEEGEYFHIDNVPWQRVINSKGMISRRQPGGAERQGQMLQQEGVEIETDSMGEMYVDFGRYGWFPRRLPSEEGDDSHDDDDDDDGGNNGTNSNGSQGTQ